MARGFGIGLSASSQIIYVAICSPKIEGKGPAVDDEFVSHGVTRIYTVYMIPPYRVRVEF